MICVDFVKLDKIVFDSNSGPFHLLDRETFALVQNMRSSSAIHFTSPHECQLKELVGGNAEFTLENVGTFIVNEQNVELQLMPEPCRPEMAQKLLEHAENIDELCFYAPENNRTHDYMVWNSILMQCTNLASQVKVLKWINFTHFFVPRLEVPVLHKIIYELEYTKWLDAYKNLKTLVFSTQLQDDFIPLFIRNLKTLLAWETEKQVKLPEFVVIVTNLNSIDKLVEIPGFAWTRFRHIKNKKVYPMILKVTPPTIEKNAIQHEAIEKRATKEPAIEDKAIVAQAISRVVQWFGEYLKSWTGQ